MCLVIYTYTPYKYVPLGDRSVIAYMFEGCNVPIPPRGPQMEIS